MFPNGNDRLLSHFSPKQICDFIKDSEVKQKSKECGVYFFGGEPTLVMDDMVRLAKELKTSIKGVELTLHTNGLLLDKVPEYLLSNLENIFVSINSEKLERKGRLTKYYFKLVNNLGEAKKTFKGTTIARHTVISNSSLYSDVMRSIGLFDLVYWQMENRLTPHTASDYASQYLQELKYLMSFWWKTLDEGKVFGLLPFVNWAAKSYGISPPFKSYPCEIGQDVIPASDGTCYICPEMLGDEEVKCGTIAEGIDLSSMKRLIKPSAECSKCEHFSHCGGRCLRMHLRYPKRHMKTYCNITKESIRTFKAYVAKHPFKDLREETKDQLEKLSPQTSLCEMVP